MFQSNQINLGHINIIFKTTTFITPNPLVIDNLITTTIDWWGDNAFQQKDLNKTITTNDNNNNTKTPILIIDKISALGATNLPSLEATNLQSSSLPTTTNSILNEANVNPTIVALPNFLNGSLTTILMSNLSAASTTILPPLSNVTFAVNSNETSTKGGGEMNKIGNILILISLFIFTLLIV